VIPGGVVVTDAAPARGLARLAAAGESWRVAYSSADVRGAPVTLTGLVHLPPSPPPETGWPVVSYGHMTTGGGPTAAPSTAVAGHPERRRMTQGDAFVSALLGLGVAVVQPDYEGLGGDPRPHPYLIGRALGSSVVDMVWAARSWEPRLGSAWVAAGHSEGAVAAAHAADSGRGLPAGLDLRGVALFAPVTRMDLTIGASLRVPVRFPGSGVVSALIGLMVSGAATADPAVRELALDGGLSDAARRRWSHLGDVPLTTAAAAGSWGDLAPAAILGSRGAELREALLDSLRANDVRCVHLRPVPVRVDAAVFDEVAPLPLTRGLVAQWRGEGREVTFRQWPTWHSGVMDHVPATAAAWVRDLL
jgi:hypothetical protein